MESRVIILVFLASFAFADELSPEYKQCLDQSLPAKARQISNIQKCGVQHQDEDDMKRYYECWISGMTADRNGMASIEKCEDMTEQPGFSEEEKMAGDQYVKDQLIKLGVDTTGFF